MKRALGLVTAAAGWVAVIQLAIGGTAPVYEVQGLVNPVVAGLVDSVRTDKTISGFAGSVAPSTTTSTTTTVPPTTSTLPPTTSTLPPTTTSPSPTTTAARTTTTTTAAPAPKPTTTTTSTTTTAPTTTTTEAESSGSFSSGAESDFISRINNLRASEGLDALAVSSSLKTYARNWSEEMATSGDFRHSDLGGYIATTNWSTLGENIGKGGSVSAIFNAFVDSEPHYANMVSPNFTHIGVGVFIDAEGVMWTTHVFGG